MEKSGWVIVLFCMTLGVLMGGWRAGALLGLALIASLLLHEVGHIVVARILWVPVREIGLRMGGAYNRRAYATRRRDEILISAAGPLTNLALSMPLLLVPHFGVQLAMCNFLLGLINLLPLPSSDGLRIVRMIRHTGLPVTLAATR